IGNRQALFVSLVSASLLTLAWSMTVKESDSNLWLNLAVTLLGIGRTVTLWLIDYIRASDTLVRPGLDYSLFFLGNLALYVGVLWGKTSSTYGRYILFAIRLPFFLLLAPIFWLGAIFVGLRFAGSEGTIRVPLQMWRGLLNWLMGSPPGYREPQRLKTF